MRVVLRNLLFLGLLMTTNPSPTLAQNALNLPTLWEGHYGSWLPDIFNACIENKHGNILAVGTTQSHLFRKSDLMLRHTDRDGNLLWSKNIGLFGQDKGFGACETIDGGYAVVGSTSSPWPQARGREDAWLVKLDYSGRIRWFVVEGTDMDDGFTSVLEGSDGELLAAGYFGDSLLVVKTNRQGAIVWKKTFNLTGRPAGLVKSATAGSYTLCVNQSGSNSGIYLLSFNAEGSLLWTNKITGSSLHTAKGITALRSGGYAAVAQTKTFEGREDIAFIKTDARGQLLCVKAIGGPDSETGSAIWQTSFGEIFVLGTSLSFRQGARRSQAVLFRYDENGASTLSEPVFMGNRNREEITAVWECNNGDFLFAGSSVKLGADPDAWLRRFRQTDRFFPNKTLLPRVTIGDIAFWESSGNDTLEANERGYFIFSIAQPSGRWRGDFRDLQLKLKSLKLAPGIKLPDRLYFGHLDSTEVRVFSVPVEGMETIGTGENALALILETSAGEPIDSVQIAFSSKAIPKPDLEVRFHSLRLPTNKPLASRRELITIYATIENKGEGVASSPELRFFYPYGVEPQGQAFTQLQSIRGKDSVVVSFSFLVKLTYRFDHVSISGMVWDTSSSKIAEGFIDIPMEAFGLPGFPAQVFTYPKGFRGGGPSLEPESSMSSLPVMEVRWIAPDPEEKTGYDFEYRLDTLGIVLSITGEEDTVIADSIRLYINNRLAEAGRDYRPEDVAFYSAADGTGRYQYKNLLHLTEGLNEIELAVRLANNREIRTGRIMKVEYVPVLPKLHLYSIGVPGIGLSCPPEDAKDIADRLGAPENHAFEKEPNIQVKATEETTELGYLDGMLHNIRKLQGRGLDTSDVLVLFIASHGFTEFAEPDNFQIATSDFYRDFDQEGHLRSLRFQTHVFLALEKIKAAKLIILDACNSAAALEYMDKRIKKPNDDLLLDTLSNALLDAVNRLPGDWHVLTSCDRDEYSYEDSTQLHNGIFTAALVEGLTLARASNGKTHLPGDANQDGIVTLKEIHSYAQRRMPAMLRRLELKKLGATQTPHLKLGNRGDLPLFQQARKL